MPRTGEEHNYGPPDLAHMSRPLQINAIRRMFPKDTPAERDLGQIKLEADQCQACPLYQGRTQSVAGSGPADARVMIVGEAPGREEDRLGVPFTGQAGQLLEGLLARAGTNRSEIFITNILKCRPPGNRDPLPSEAAACRNFLQRQRQVINPQIIVTLGKFSTEAFLPNVKYRDARGKLLLNPDNQPVLPIMHPAAILRRREWRRELIDGFGTLAKALDGEIMPVEPELKKPATTLAQHKRGIPLEQRALL